MTVNSISLSYSASSYGAYQQKLTTATKQKLIELGVSFSSNITEQEGQALVQKALKNKAQKTSQKNQTQNDTQEKEKTNTSQDNLAQQAINLANKLGISASKDDDFTTLITKIENTLETKIAQNQNNVEMLNKLKNYSSELATIEKQAGNYNKSNSNDAQEVLMMSLEMLSRYNQNQIAINN